MREKIKRYVDILQNSIVYILIIMIAFASFGLGRLSVQPVVSENAIVQESFQVPIVAAAVPATIKEIEISGGNLVASVSGTKYHYPWCSGAQRIKETNKIWFENIDAARESGYTPAANCKGLK